MKKVNRYIDFEDISALDIRKAVHQLAHIFRERKKDHTDQVTVDNLVNILEGNEIIDPNDIDQKTVTILKKIHLLQEISGGNKAKTDLLIVQTQALKRVKEFISRTSMPYKENIRETESMTRSVLFDEKSIRQTILSLRAVINKQKTPQRIIQLLEEHTEGLTNRYISDTLHLNKSTTSSHLKKQRRAGIINVSMRDRKHYYTLKVEKLKDIQLLYEELEKKEINLFDFANQDVLRILNHMQETETVYETSIYDHMQHLDKDKVKEYIEKMISNKVIKKTGELVNIDGELESEYKLENERIKEIVEILSAFENKKV